MSIVESTQHSPQVPAVCVHVHVCVSVEGEKVLISIR